MPNSLLRSIKLWCLLPALFYSPYRWIKRRQRFAFVENEDIMLLLSWLMMAHTRRGDSRQRDATQEASEEAKLERASSECLHAGRVKVAASNLLAKPRSAGNEEAWNTLVTKFLAGDTAAAAAELASVTDVEEGNALPWRPDDEYASAALFEICENTALNLRGKDLAIITRTSTAATRDGVGIIVSSGWFAPTSNLGRRHF